jgi:TRAP-type C4-dicarboxylate transport system permease small subunit
VRFLSIPVKALMAIFLVVVIINAIPVIGKNMSQLSPAIGIPMGIVYLAIPIGAAIMLIYTLDDLIELIHPRVASGTTGGR